MPIHTAKNNKYLLCIKKEIVLFQVSIKSIKKKKLKNCFGRDSNTRP